MTPNNLYQTESTKSPAAFSRDLEAVLSRKGFIINNKGSMDMAASFAAHGAAVSDTFDLHMIQVCKPDKAAKSLSANPERAVLMPKFIMAFSSNGTTQIRFLHFSEDVIRSVVHDDTFPGSLTESYTNIIGFINQAK